MKHNLSDEDKKKWAEMIAKCWTDEAFKKRFKENPTAVLNEFGINCPSNITYKVVEDTKDTIYLHIPQKPEANLSEADLKKTAAAQGCGICW